MAANFFIFSQRDQPPLLLNFFHPETVFFCKAQSPSHSSRIFSSTLLSAVPIIAKGTVFAARIREPDERCA